MSGGVAPFTEAHGPDLSTNSEPPVGTCHREERRGAGVLYMASLEFSMKELREALEKVTALLIT